MEGRRALAVSHANGVSQTSSALTFAEPTPQQLEAAQRVGMRSRHRRVEPVRLLYVAVGATPVEGHYVTDALA